MSQCCYNFVIWLVFFYKLNYIYIYMYLYKRKHTSWLVYITPSAIPQYSILSFMFYSAYIYIYLSYCLHIIILLSKNSGVFCVCVCVSLWFVCKNCIICCIENTYLLVMAWILGLFRGRGDFWDFV